MAAQHPERIAIIIGSDLWNYQKLNNAINALASHLQLEPGTQVAFPGKPTLSTILLFFAILRSHAIACPFNLETAVRDGKEIDPDTLPIHIQLTPSIPSFLNLNTLATFLLTSGSSGNPKIACHTIGNHYYNAVSAMQALNLLPTSRYLLSLPLFHVSGIAVLFRSFLQGSAVVLRDQTLTTTLIEQKITHVSLVPTQLYRILQEPPAIIQTIANTLQYALIGGDALSETLHKQALLHQLPIYTTYGMTEMSSMITLNGYVLSDRKVKIAEDGEIWVGGKTLFAGYLNQETSCSDWFPTGDLGKWTYPNNLKNREFDKEAPPIFCLEKATIAFGQGASEDKKLGVKPTQSKTNSSSCLGISSKLSIIGRKDRLFISGGENIQPEEIEEALCAIPGILRSCIVPISDEEFGKRPIAYILEEIEFHTVHTIHEALFNILPSFKHPVQILPFTSAMKDSLKNLWNRDRAERNPIHSHVNHPNFTHF